MARRVRHVAHSERFQDEAPHAPGVQVPVRHPGVATGHYGDADHVGVELEARPVDALVLQQGLGVPLHLKIKEAASGEKSVQGVETEEGPRLGRTSKTDE